MTGAAERTRTPAHLWAVGIASLLWNALGAIDFVLTNLRVAGYIRHIPVETMDRIDMMNWWSIGLWGLGMGSALLGSVLLLKRSRFAVTTFAVSLLGLAVNAGETLAMTGAMLAMGIAIWAAAILMFAYALNMRRRGLLV